MLDQRLSLECLGFFLCETHTVKVFIHFHQKMFMNILCALLKLFKGTESTVHDCRDHSGTI